jgi:hypothetical protein
MFCAFLSLTVVLTVWPHAGSLWAVASALLASMTSAVHLPAHLMPIHGSATDPVSSQEQHAHDNGQTATDQQPAQDVAAAKQHKKSRRRRVQKQSECRNVGDYAGALTRSEADGSAVGAEMKGAMQLNPEVFSGLPDVYSRKRDAQTASTREGGAQAAAKPASAKWPSRSSMQCVGRDASTRVCLLHDIVYDSKKARWIYFGTQGEWESLQTPAKEPFLSLHRCFSRSPVAQHIGTWRNPLQTLQPPPCIMSRLGAMQHGPAHARAAAS